MATKSSVEAHIEDGDQKQTGDEYPPAFEAGQENAHDIHDPKDSLSLGNRKKIEEKMEREEEEEENQKSKRPTEIAKSHGNEPSRGAKIDEQLQKEDEERIRQKDGN